MDEKNQITEGVIWKQLLIFFFPIVIGTFFQQIYNTAYSIVVGRFVGKEALAAVGGSVNQIVNLVVEVFVGLTSGASVIVAQFYGAKDKKNLNKTLHTSYAFGIVTGFVVAVVGLLVTNTVLELMKTPQELMADSRLYLHIYFCGMIFNIIYNMGASILRAVGDSRRPLYVLMVTCGLNIVLDILLVVIFRLGVMGVAIATVSCQGISSILVTAMLMKEHPLFQLKLREIRFYRVSLNSVLRIGIPAALEATMYTIANLIIQVFVNELGTDTVAAWGTFAKIDAVYWMVVNAFGISITTFVDTAGRPVKFGHGFARYGSIEFFHAFKFLLKGFHRRNLRHIRMGHRMVSHNMPLCDHAFDKIGIIFDKISDSKKDSGSLVLFKCLQDCRGVSILISGIKSQIEDFFVSIAGIIGVVLFQIIDRGVSGRTFSFFLKT